jgi:hypothetical protein
MNNLESGNLAPAHPRRKFLGLSISRAASLVTAAALAVLLTVPLPLCAQDTDSATSSPMGQLPQMAVGQTYQVSPDPDNPNGPGQFQPVPNGDSDDPSMNSDDDDNNSDDNADNGDNDQNQNDDDSDNGPDNSASDSDSPPPPPPSN